MYIYTCIYIYIYRLAKETMNVTFFMRTIVITFSDFITFFTLFRLYYLQVYDKYYGELEDLYHLFGSSHIYVY